MDLQAGRPAPLQGLTRPVFLLDAVERRGLLTRQDIEAALDGAEARTPLDPRYTAALSPANRDAIAADPISADRADQGAGSPHLFSEIAACVGQTKPER